MSERTNCGRCGGDRFLTSWEDKVRCPECGNADPDDVPAPPPPRCTCPPVAASNATGSAECPVHGVKQWTGLPAAPAPRAEEPPLCGDCGQPTEVGRAFHVHAGECIRLLRASLARANEERERAEAKLDECRGRLALVSGYLAQQPPSGELELMLRATAAEFDWSNEAAREAAMQFVEKATRMKRPDVQAQLATARAEERALFRTALGMGEGAGDWTPELNAAFMRENEKVVAGEARAEERERIAVLLETAGFLNVRSALPPSPTPTEEPTT